jgi:hypothetical protein
LLACSALLLVHHKLLFLGGRQRGEILEIHSATVSVARLAVN